MPLFRKKPVAITADQWFKNGDHPLDDCEMFERPGASIPAEPPIKGEGKIVRYYRRPDVAGEKVCGKCGQTMHVHGWLDTLEGNDGAQVVCPSDWIITGVRGERYPIKDSIFRETYEPVTP